MNENSENNTAENTIHPEQTEDMPHSIFTKQEIKTFVKNFLLSYGNGLIKINFPLRDEILRNANWAGKPISKSEAEKRELNGKNRFLDLIMICSGRKNATPKEVEQITSILFRRIMGLYAGGRVEGKISEVTLEERLSQVEKNLFNISELVMQLKDSHKNGVLK